MADIKQIIDDNIYQNGQQRITGIVMNSVLKAMVDDTDEKVGDLAQELEQIEEEKATIAISDINDRRVEIKVNAILVCLRHLIPNIVFHNGVPYSIPTELKDDLKLDAHNEKTFAYGLALPISLM